MLIVRKIKSYKTGADEIPDDFRCYGTPINYFKHLKGFLLASQVAQLLSTLASSLSPLTRLEDSNLLEAALS